MSYQRRISPNERLYMAGDTLVPPLAIQLVFAGEGALSFETLRDAVATAAEACPAACVHAVGSNWVADSTHPRLRPAVLRAHLPDDIEVHDWSGARRALAPREGRGVEVWLLRGASRVRIVFRVHHALMDGRGALLFAERVFASLRGDTWPTETSEVVDVEMPARDPQTATQRRPGLALDCRSPLGVARADDRDFVWLSSETAGAPSAVIARLATGLANFGAERGVGGALRFMVPVDLRRHLPRTESGEEPLHSGNLSLPLFLEVAQQAAWATVQQTLLQKLGAREELSLDGTEALVSRAPFAALQRGTGVLERIQRVTGRYLASGILSHLGRVKLARYSCSDFMATGLSALTVHVPLAPVTITAVEVEGPLGTSLHLSMSCPRRAAGEGRAFLNQWSRSLSDLQRRPPDVDACRAHEVALDPSWSPNQASIEFPREETLGSVFRRAAVRHGADVAVVEGDRTLRYEELLRAAEAVASRLIEDGVMPGEVVAVSGGRSLATVSALLGTLLAGAAYLPIDPSYPASRVSQMLADAQCTRVLIDPAYAEVLSTATAQVDVKRMIIGDPTHAPASVAFVDRGAPDALAYVLYTSGSTGRPKGVEITHRNLLHYVAWATERYGVDAQSVFGWFTSIAFDLSGTSLFLPLLAGGRLVLHDGEVTPALLFEAGQAGATHLKLTPSHLQAMVQLKVSAPEVRALIVGGEQLMAHTAEAALSICHASCRVFNEYGPTEATIGCVVATYDRTEVDGGVVPIGLPVPGTQAVVVTEAGDYVRGAEPGELLIGGEGLARGYRNAPELTAARFVQRDGQRWYRTGDVVQRLPHGGLAFRGRLDDQVKVRGHRVELGEIERTLCTHPDVTGACAQLFRVGERFVLGAHVTLATHATSDVLLGHVRAHLPEYMVPTFAQPIDAFPLTPNGKVDRAKLHPPARFLKAGERAADAPAAHEVEGVPAAVVSAWCAVLGGLSDSPSPDDDFFARGGDSVALLELLAKIEQTTAKPGWARAFAVADFLAEPTLGCLGRLASNVLPESDRFEEVGRP